MKQFFLLALIVLAAFNANAQLIINEVSQGVSNGEYVELLVTGTPTCGGSNTVDIRGWIIDDNNSWHATGSGTGIAGGHVRFDSIAQWANVKIGSLIVVYDNANISSFTNDISDSNNDQVYIVPVSSSVLQKNTTLPASGGSMTTYATATTYSGTGVWGILGMANGGDAFHTVSPANYAAAYHAIGWGNNSNNIDIYFSADQGGKVIYMANLVDNDPYNQANYIDTAIAVGETPGAANNSANAAWIASLRQTPAAPAVTLTNPNPLSCSNSTTVLIASTQTPGATYLWSTGTTTANDTVSTSGTYYVTVSDASGTCNTVDSITITASATLDISVSSTPTTCGGTNGSATVTLNTGTATGYLWNNTGNTATISGLAAGNYSVTVTGNGNCSASASVTVSSSNGGTPVNITAGQTSFCAFDSTSICAPDNYTYLWNTGAITKCITVKQAGNYYVTVTDANNCTATSNTVAISVLPAPPVSISVNGDTLTSYNASGYQWYRDGVLIPGATSATYVTTQGGSYTVVVTGVNGCTAQSLPVVVTGIDAITLQQQFSIYPNPLTGNNWTIEAGKDLMGARYSIFDNNGRLVYTSEIAGPKTTVDADMARGVYWLKVSSGATTFTTKLVKL